MRRAQPEATDFNDVLLRHIEESADLMRARDTLFVVLVTTAGAALTTVAGEEMLLADMLGRMDVADLELAEATWVSLPPKEAIEFFRRKVPMVRDEYEALQDRYKAKGFHVTGLRHRYAVEKVHAALSEAIERGATKRDFIKALRDPGNSAGLQRLTRRHLELVFDHNVLAAYSAGRYQQMTRPDVLAARPFWQYSTAGDGGVRPVHRAMHGRVFAADNPVWDEWWPPNGYKCRCTVFSLSPDDIEREGLKVEDAPPHSAEVDGKVVQIVPDPGFSGSPRTQARADAVIGRMRKRVKADGSLRAPQLAQIEVPKDPGGSTRPARPAVFNSAGDILRSQDRRRAAKLDELAGLTRSGAVQEAEDVGGFFNIFPRGQLGHVPKDEVWVEIPLYSQNLDTAEQLVLRLAGRPDVGHLVERTDVATRVSYGPWNPQVWPDPEVVFDDFMEAKQRQIIRAGETFASSSETVLRIRVRNQADLDAAKSVALETETSKGGSHVRRAWETGDIRIRGTAIAAQDEQFRSATLNRRPRGSGEQVVLSKSPLAGWKSDPVTVNAKLWDFLPAGG